MSLCSSSLTVECFSSSFQKCFNQMCVSFIWIPKKQDTKVVFCYDLFQIKSESGFYELWKHIKLSLVWNRNVFHPCRTSTHKIQTHRAADTRRFRGLDDNEQQPQTSPKQLLSFSLRAYAEQRNFSLSDSSWVCSTNGERLTKRYLLKLEMNRKADKSPLHFPSHSFKLPVAQRRTHIHFL